MSSGVFLSEVDDYLAPSQACVNPLFSDKKEEERTNQENSNGLQIRTRRRRPLNTTAKVPEVPRDPVKASISDCLACSGCVTTAETVLVEEQHSMQALRNLIKQRETCPTIVATISPAAWADIFRHLQLQVPESMDTIRHYQQQFTTLLNETLAVSMVVDGNLPLQWSLRLAAEEFCQAYQRDGATNDNLTEVQRLQAQLTPSVAVSSTKHQYLLPQGGTKTVEVTPKFTPYLPILSSSCPALVCLVEKSTGKAVSHLSSVKSSLALLGAQLRKTKCDIFHLGIMPCHDKKLEASRKDFQDDEHVKDMNMVITTAECVRLVTEALAEFDSHLDLRERLLSMRPASISSTIPEEIGRADAPLLVSPEVHLGECSSANEGLQVLGSGGYAEYIFRYACRLLFGVVIQSAIWKPVKVDTARQQSVRVASKRHRDFYEATLFRTEDGKYTTEESASSEPVLRFAIAYGMQTLQRVLKTFDEQNLDTPNFHYIEAMACPSGCLNGGGMIRLSEREAPSETRQRLAATEKYFTTPGKPNNEFPLTDSQSLTSYHIVPLLAHSSGAAAGVAVKDMQW